MPCWPAMKFALFSHFEKWVLNFNLMSFLNDFSYKFLLGLICRFFEALSNAHKFFVKIMTGFLEDDKNWASTFCFGHGYGQVNSYYDLNCSSAMATPASMGHCNDLYGLKRYFVRLCHLTLRAILWQLPWKQGRIQG